MPTRIASSALMQIKLSHYTDRGRNS